MKLGVVVQGQDLSFIDTTFGSDLDYEKVLNNLVPDFIAVGPGLPGHVFSDVCADVMTKLAGYALRTNTKLYLIYWFAGARSAEDQAEDILDLVHIVGVENLSGIIIRCRESIIEPERVRISALVKWNFPVPVGLAAWPEDLLSTYSEARCALDNLDHDSDFIVPMVNPAQDLEKVASNLQKLRELGFDQEMIPALLILGKNEGLSKLGEVLPDDIHQICLWSWKYCLDLKVWQTLTEVSAMARKKEQSKPQVPQYDKEVTHVGRVMHAGLAKRSAPSPAAKVTGSLPFDEQVQFVKIEGTSETRSQYGLSVEGFWALIRQGSQKYIELQEISQ